MDEAGVVMDDQENLPTTKPAKGASNKSSYGKYSLEQLEDELKNVLAEEDYKKAAVIRDEIKKRAGDQQ